jgi:GR25 family glycosyltransferase involved in LPS biosynthesis
MGKLLPNLTIIDAVTSRDLDPDAVRKLISTGFVRDFTDAFVQDRKISVGQLACFLSHRKAFERISMDSLGPLDKAVILEDDVVLHPNFLETIEKTTRALDDDPIDMINFYVHPTLETPNFQSSRDLAPTPRGFWGTQCYAFKLTGLRVLQGGTTGMLGAFDEQITRIPCIRSMTYVGPAILHEDKTVGSTIENSTCLFKLLENT